MQTATVTIRDTVWQVDVAETASERSQGLSNVPAMSAYTGMLFDMGSEQIISIQTENMLFSLDVLYLNESLVVTEVKENVLPGQSSVLSELPARYFMEVSAGEFSGIGIGDAATVTGYTPSSGMSSVIETMVTMMIVIMMMGMMMRTMKEV